MNEKQEELNCMPEKVQLRIELLFKEKKKRFSKSKPLCSPIQGSPFNIVLQITNISESVFKGGTIHSAEFNYHNSSSITTIDNETHIHALNPKEKTEVTIDQATLKVDGACWFSMGIEPDDENQEIYTFQYDSFHKTDGAFNETNKWGATVYIEGKLALLQATTNHYILILTAITVLEAVFGIKNILKWAALILAKLFSLLSNSFSYLSSLT